MPHSCDLIGPKTPEERREIEEHLDRARTEARRPAKGEAEKTPEDLRAIEAMNVVVRRALEQLGIDATDIASEQAHLLDNEAFTALAGKPGWEWSGFANADLDAMYVKTASAYSYEAYESFFERLEQEKERKQDEAIEDAGDEATEELGLVGYPKEGDAVYQAWDAAFDRILGQKRDELDAWVGRQKAQYDANERYQFFATMVHEALHLQAFRRFYLEHTSEDDESALTHRNGYHYYHAGGDDYFLSLNEAITQELTEEAIRQSRDVLGAAGIPFPEAPTEEEEWDREEREEQQERGYVEDRKLLRFLMERIAQRRGETVEAVWRRFTTNYFTGGMMHLRDIERTFGRGALRFYASIRPKDLVQRLLDSLSKERRDAVWAYFKTDDVAERERMRWRFEDSLKLNKGGEDEEGDERGEEG